MLMARWVLADQPGISLRLAELTPAAGSSASIWIEQSAQAEDGRRTGMADASTTSPRSAFSRQHDLALRIAAVGLRRPQTARTTLAYQRARQPSTRFRFRLANTACTPNAAVSCADIGHRSAGKGRTNLVSAVCRPPLRTRIGLASPLSNACFFGGSPYTGFRGYESPKPALIYRCA